MQVYVRVYVRLDKVKVIFSLFSFEIYTLSLILSAKHTKHAQNSLSSHNKIIRVCPCKMSYLLYIKYSRHTTTIWIFTCLHNTNKILKQTWSVPILVIVIILKGIKFSYGKFFKIIINDFAKIWNILKQMF